MLPTRVPYLSTWSPPYNSNELSVRKKIIWSLLQQKTFTPWTLDQPAEQYDNRQRAYNSGKLWSHLFDFLAFLCSREIVFIHNSIFIFMMIQFFCHNEIFSEIKFLLFLNFVEKNRDSKILRRKNCRFLINCF